LSTDNCELVFRHHFSRLEPLLFGRITHIVVDDSQNEQQPYCGLRITGVNGDIYEIIADADEEGNGPGHLTITKVEPRGKTAVG
jgi:hypothetical protein